MVERLQSAIKMLQVLVDRRVDDMNLTKQELEETKAELETIIAAIDCWLERCEEAYFVAGGSQGDYKNKI